MLHVYKLFLQLVVQFGVGFDLSRLPTCAVWDLIEAREVYTLTGKVCVFEEMNALVCIGRYHMHTFTCYCSVVCFMAFLVA